MAAGHRWAYGVNRYAHLSICHQRRWRELYGSPLTDQQLIAAARAGSKTAWATLLERYYPLILRYVTARTADAEMAADLTQEVFVTVLALLDRAPADRPLTPWLYRIAQNHLARSWRRLGLHRTISLEELSETRNAIVPALHSPDELASMVAEKDLVARVLADLSAPLREALLLHALKGLSAAEVADVQRISLAAAQRRISRAKKQFRERYNLLRDGDRGTR